ncbi:MAG: mannosyltransferase family protein [Ktedonobacteraceae bacterium]
MDTNQLDSSEEHLYDISRTQTVGTGIIEPPQSAQVVAQQPAHSQNWRSWFAALKAILPIYIATRLAFLTISCLAPLFTVKDFSPQAFPISTLWHSWNHWDAEIFTTIARYGYTQYQRAVFFPLYPLIERATMFVTGGDVILAGLLISNLASLGICIVLYRLICEDFTAEQAERSVLYFVLFPTAFFLASGYNEALFLFLALLSFYHVRRGHWWLAGLCGFLASLTRSAGILLVIPFAYEYLRQRQFQWKAIRWNALAGVLIPCGVAVYALWCYIRFNDPLAFTHGEVYWHRFLAFPGYGIFYSMLNIHRSAGLLSFQALRNATDLLPDLLILLFVVLCFVGPWRLPRHLWVYGVYAAAVFVFLQLFPKGGTGLYPLESVGRYVLEVFPAFIIMAAAGRYKLFHLCYLMVSGAALFFLLTQFLTAHWVL